MSERWMPKHGELYYYISTTGVVTPEKFNEYDAGKNARCFCGNCFRTVVEAVSAAEKFKAFLLSLHEPVTDCNQLPKLTAEVFDLPDCPPWAKYAAVDRDGTSCFFDEKPICDLVQMWVRGKNGEHFMAIRSNKFDASDWQNSLIERPEKKTLPEWCKVGEYMWRGGEYFEVTEIHLSDDWVGFKNIVTGVRGCYTPRYLSDHFKQARLRPYNAEEMKALMGKVIEKGPSMHIVTGFENVFDNECMVHANGCLYGANDLLRQFNISNAPCGVLEHLENGKWVE